MAIMLLDLGNEVLAIRSNRSLWGWIGNRCIGVSSMCCACHCDKGIHASGILPCTLRECTSPAVSRLHSRMRRDAQVIGQSDGRDAMESSISCGIRPWTRSRRRAGHWIKMIFKMANLVTSLESPQSCYASHGHGRVAATILVEELLPDLKTISNLRIG